MPKQNVFVIGLCCLFAGAAPLFGMSRTAQFKGYRLSNPAPRAASWPAKVEYAPTSIYLLLDPQFNDKVSVLELNPSGQGFLLSQFGEFVPGYNIVEPKQNVLYLDPADALCLGVQIPSATIVHASLNIMGASKTLEKKGQSKYDLTPSIELLCNSLIVKINRARILHATIAPATAAIVTGGAIGARLTRLVLPEGNLGHIQAPQAADHQYLQYAMYGLTAATTTAAMYLNYKHEATAIANGVTCLELLVAGQSSNTTYISDPNAAKASVQKLQNKLAWWDWVTAVDALGILNEEAVNRLQAVIDAL